MKSYREYLNEESLSESVDKDFMKLGNLASDVKNKAKDVVRANKSSDAGKNRAISAALSTVEDNVGELLSSLDKLQKELKS